MSDPMHDLEVSLTQHDLAVKRSADWFVVADRPERLRARYTTEVPMQGGLSVQLEVDTLLPDGRIINECFAGRGVDRESAERDARDGFWASALHVLLAAYWEKFCEGQTEIETWRINGADWRVILGPYRIRGPAQAFRPAPPLIERLEELVKAMPLTGDTHWCRSYYAWWPGLSTRAAECLWDNKPWAEGERMLGDIAWPKLDGFWSIRHFMLLQRAR